MNLKEKRILVSVKEENIKISSTLFPYVLSSIIEPMISTEQWFADAEIITI